MERRNFLQSSSLGLSAAFIASSSAQALNTSERAQERQIVLGIMGCSRGIGLFEGLDRLITRKAWHIQVVIPLQVKLNVFDLEHSGLAMLGKLTG